MMDQKDSQLDATEEIIEESERSCENADAIEVIEEMTEAIGPLEPEQKKKMIKVLQRVSFQGPIPPPSMLKNYEDIEPGLASRIVAMAEKDQMSVVEHNKKKLELQGRDSLLGALISFFIVIVIIIAAVVLLLNGYDLAGFTSLVLGSVVILKLFLSK